jgi:hypothetical protein
MRNNRRYRDIDIMKFKTSAVRAAVVGALVVLGTGGAFASTVTLSYSTTSTGTAGSGVNTYLPVPGSYTYADTFSAGAGATPVSGTKSGFFDDYVFTISSATANSITSTIDLGGTLQINGLQVSLFSYAAGQTVPLFGSTLPPGSVEIGAWSTAFNSGPTSGTVAVIPATQLNAGTYALEVRGTVSGSAGGSYSGQLNLAPVPLPAALPLLLSGLGGLWLLPFRRRRAD